MTTEMNVNCILTFETINALAETQDFFDLKLNVAKHDTCWTSFLNEKFFCSIAAKCKELGRDVKDLWKISTCSDWSIYNECTGTEGLKGHSGKWVFGNGGKDINDWEKELMDLYGFGENVDLSWIYAEDRDKQAQERMNALREKIIAQLELNKAA